jgi:uroporphyrin-3 C-methyltransferase
LSALARAITKDLARIQSSSLADTPALLIKLDELVRLVDELPLGNAVGGPATSVNGGSQTTFAAQPKALQAENTIPGWQFVLDRVKTEVRGLLRVSRVEAPDAAMLSPEQSFFVRENLKLKLLNARLGLLARQLDASRGDLASASASLQRYFSASSAKTQVAAALLQQIQVQMRVLELPRVDETLGALTTAAAGR